MYVPRQMEETRLEVLHELIRTQPFGALVTLADGGLDANHLPLLLDTEPAPFGCLRGHVARANPLWRSAGVGQEALVLFQGPHAYVSPSWYPSKQETGKAVPTWNYAVVHAHGALRVIEDPAWLREHLQALTDRHEADRADRWRLTDAPADYLDKLIGAVVGIEIRITRLVGKWKVSQTRPAADRQGVVDGLLRESDGQAAAMAELVRETL